MLSDENDKGDQSERDLEPIGLWKKSRVEKYLKLIGEEPVKRKQVSKAAFAAGGLWGERKWRFTEHAFGYIGQSNSDNLYQLKNVSEVQADPTLRGASITITLDRLHVFDYPGSGEHLVLVKFEALHSPEGAADEPVQFCRNFRAMNGSLAGVQGYPVFRNLRVAQQGVGFSIYTVNVKSAKSEAALSFLDSETFTNGLSLLSTANPAIAPVTQLAQGLTKMVLKQSRNAAVQDIHIGLDFSNQPARAPLRTGSYVAVQVENAAAWDWSNIFLNRKNGQLVEGTEGKDRLAFNYFVFTISKDSSDRTSVGAPAP